MKSFNKKLIGQRIYISKNNLNIYSKFK